MKKLKKYVIFCISFLAVSIIRLENVFAMKQLPIELSSLQSLPLNVSIGKHYEYDIPNQSFKIELDYESDGINIKLQSTNGTANKQAKYYTNNIQNVVWYVYITENNLYGVYFMEGTMLQQGKIYIEARNDTCDNNEWIGICKQTIENNYIYNPNETSIANMNWTSHGRYEINGIEGTWAWWNRQGPGRKLKIIGGNIPIVISNRVPIPTESMYTSNWNTNKQYIEGIYDFNSYSKYDIVYTSKIKSIDMTYSLDINNKLYTINITTQNEMNLTQPTFEFYGLKVNTTTIEGENYNTYYFEKIQNNNDISVSNIIYTPKSKGYTLQFNLNIIRGNYRFITLKIKTEPELFNVIVDTADNYPFSLDLNTIGSKYTAITSVSPWTTIKNIYVDSKNGDNINYRYYVKRDTEYSQISFYEYRKTDNIVENGLETSIIRNGSYENWLYPNNPESMTKETGSIYIQTGLIELGQNKPNALYIAMTNVDIESADSHSIYMSDEVYFTFPENFKLIANYGNTNIDTSYNISNQYLQEQYAMIDNYNMDYFVNFINDYIQYKDDWLELFNSIYEPLPTLIKSILVFLWFSLHAYAIFLIFKD